MKYLKHIKLTADKQAQKEYNSYYSDTLFILLAVPST